MDLNSPSMRTSEGSGAEQMMFDFNTNAEIVNIYVHKLEQSKNDRLP